MRLLIFLLVVAIILVFLVACFPSRPIQLSVSVAVQPIALSEGATALITVTAVPEPIQQVTVSVDGRNLGSALTSPASFVWIARGVGDHVVEARAVSTIYGEGIARTFVQVSDATPPLITSVNIMPTVPQPSEPFAILIQAEDPESPYLDITFRCGAVTKSQRFTSPPYVLEIDGLPEGLNTYVVEVVNDTGKSAHFDGELLVSPPDTSPPHVLLSAPDFVRAGEILRFNITVEDELSLSSVRVSLDATTLESTNIPTGEKVWSQGFEWPSVDAGTHFINVTAADLHGNTVSTTTSIVVNPASSVRVKLTVDRENALPGETVNFSATVEGGTPTVVDFYVDGTLAQSSTSTSFHWTVEPGRHLIGVRIVSNGLDAYDGLLYKARDVVPPSVETRYQGVLLSSTSRTVVPVVPNGIIVVSAHDISGVETDSSVQMSVLKYEMGTYITINTTQLYLQSLSADTQTATFVGILNYEISEEVVLRLTGIVDDEGNTLQLDYPVAP